MVSLRFSEQELADRRTRITQFIADTAEAAGTDAAIIGMSGGIDSSLTAALAVDALGSDAVLGMSMPAAVSGERHQTDADQVADWLGIQYKTVDVEPIVAAVDQAYPDGALDRLARGNTRARVRAVLAYAVANNDGGVVLGTGNRTEALVGYFTKFGDGAVDCHPIGNLYKCQVRQLAHLLGVPEDIIEKPPTAELWEDQSDEDELGIGYDTLDTILALHIDGPLSAEATAETIDCPRETIERIEELVATSTHKRNVPPTP